MSRANPKNDWPKGPTVWIEGDVLNASIPFTWNLPSVRRLLVPKPSYIRRAVIGGPAVELMPDYFADVEHVEIGHDCPGILQRVNPWATRTTTGCVNRCGFCAVPKIEGKLVELADWPDLPVICDNNLLAASIEHFDRVIDRLKKWESPDFNQGVDARLLNDHHAARFRELEKPVIRLALDSMRIVDRWGAAYDRLRSAGLPKKSIRSYALIGFDSDPAEAWDRCEYVKSFGIKVLPMWFHPLGALEKNAVTERQRALGWNDYERRRIMQWFYKHKKAVQHSTAGERQRQLHL